MRRFDGLDWVPVGNTAFSAGAADYLAMTVGPNDVPYVVFRDAADYWGDRRIPFRCFYSFQ